MALSCLLSQPYKRQEKAIQDHDTLERLYLPVSRGTSQCLPEKDGGGDQRERERERERSEPFCWGCCPCNWSPGGICPSVKLFLRNSLTVFVQISWSTQWKAGRGDYKTAWMFKLLCYAGIMWMRISFVLRLHFKIKLHLYSFYFFFS